VIKIHRRVFPGVILCFAGVAIGDDFMADGSLVGVNALQMPELVTNNNTTTTYFKLIHYTQNFKTLILKHYILTNNRHIYFIK
jgi:hypothetical protein